MTALRVSLSYTEGHKHDEESSTQEEVENSVEGGEEESGKEAEKPPDVRFEAYIMQNQRILETDDDIVRFHDRLPDANADSLNTTRSPDGAEGGLQGGGWQFQNPSRVRKRIKQIIRRELDRQDALSEEEAAKVRCIVVILVSGTELCNRVLLEIRSWFGFQTL